jgi:hypothetical protein
MVARGWGCDRSTGEHRQQDAGDHKGPPFPTPPPSPLRNPGARAQVDALLIELFQDEVGEFTNVPFRWNIDTA